MTKRKSKFKKDVCPACGSKDYEYSVQGKYYKCKKCGFVWDESLIVQINNPMPSDWRASELPEDKEDEPKHDVTYGEDTFEQEDDEYHEEVW